MEATFQHDRIDRPAPRVPCQPLDVHILNRLFKFGLYDTVIDSPCWLTYLIFVIFFTLAKFLENKIYTEKRQFFALNL